MLPLKAFHIMAMVAWFAGLFYLPRLFVYHVDASDEVSLKRFQIMERRLYYGITWPAGSITTLLGVGLVAIYPAYYLHAGWMHAKLLCVLLLWGFHLSCGHYRRQLTLGTCHKSSRFFRVFNEIPTLLLFAIIWLVVVKPGG